ncbi:hypothetical protein SSBR45G_46340 [Bradyrhizobium sp. SSBR45G]|uniref:hypothetical protein n=1 Tax=unclassified Bradyrhizobium TaxID=2631580 RepID=UPI002342AE5F|nr:MULTISPECIES: hypothetical protein [unclassified Bradyrhizobium]GLH79725.1 hypothetical protein SSBR45G_46340 [Bradyrhizobium sp. SSBR45G]GLH87157.1 hypothetical protein SSBR45R_46170 [Bradyrhizobium sp. SSBR45R]
MDAEATSPNVNALRQRRYRERQREGAPSDAVFSHELCSVVLERLDEDDGLKVAVSQVRSRLLRCGFSLSGINRVILRKVGSR